MSLCVGHHMDSFTPTLVVLSKCDYILYLAHGVQIQNLKKTYIFTRLQQSTH
jgi:hypothetical protein